MITNPTADLTAALDICSLLKYDSELFSTPTTIEAIDAKIESYLAEGDPRIDYNRPAIRQV